MIRHDLNLAALSAHRTIVLVHGRAAISGTAAETVTNDILHRAFGVTNAVNHVPGPDAPFALPQHARRM